MSTLTEPTHPANGTSATAKNERPHRRLSLTRPTLPSTTPTTEPLNVSIPAAGSIPVEDTPTTVPTREAATSSSRSRRQGASGVAPHSGATQSPDENTANTAAPVVRVMAYLSEPEAALLDDLWIQFRRSPQRPSKSDILRAALTLASTHTEELTVTISQQQTNTLSRQRISKSKKPD